MLTTFSNIATIVGLVVSMAGILKNFFSNHSDQSNFKVNMKTIRKTLFLNFLVLILTFILLLCIHTVLNWIIKEELVRVITYIVGTFLGLILLGVYILNEITFQKRGLIIQKAILNIKDIENKINNFGTKQIVDIWKKLENDNDISSEIKNIKLLKNEMDENTRRIQKWYIKTRMSYFFMPMIMFSYSEMIPKNITSSLYFLSAFILMVYLFNFIILYPKVRFENGEIEFSYSMFKEHIKELEKYQK